MNKKSIIAFYLLILFGIISIGALFFFHEGIVMFNPKGMIGVKQKSLLLISTFLMMLVVMPTFILTFFIAWKYRAENKKAKYDPKWDNSILAEVIWWGIPFAIILVLGVIGWRSCHELDPFKPIDNGKKPLTIQVVALQWKWLFLYPEQNIASVNFIQFPKNVPLQFEITADAPMNSFWIPQLGGQVYAMAGMKSRLHLLANEDGEYRGSSANISGEGFAGMTFVAKASSEREFENWVNSAKQSGQVLSNDVYNQLIKPSQYNAVQTFTIENTNLFEQIIKKYMQM